MFARVDPEVCKTDVCQNTVLYIFVLNSSIMVYDQYSMVPLL